MVLKKTILAVILSFFLFLLFSQNKDDIPGSAADFKKKIDEILKNINEISNKIDEINNKEEGIEVKSNLKEKDLTIEKPSKKQKKVKSEPVIEKQEKVFAIKKAEKVIITEVKVVKKAELKSDGPDGEDTYKLIKKVFGSSALEDNPDQWYLHDNVKHVVEEKGTEAFDCFKIAVHRDEDLRQKEINKRIYHFNSSSIKMMRPSDNKLITYQNDAARYSWKMKIDNDFGISTVKTNFFEINSFSESLSTRAGTTASDESLFPLIALEASKKDGRSIFQLTKKPYKNLDALILSEIEFSDIAGKWLEVELTLNFKEEGYIRFSLKELNGKELMFYERNITKMLYENSYDFFYPSWCIKRDITEKHKFRPDEEKIFFADFKIEKLIITIK